MHRVEIMIREMEKYGWQRFWKYTFRVWKVGLQPLKEHASHMMVGTKILCHFVVMWLLRKIKL